MGYKYQAALLLDNGGMRPMLAKLGSAIVRGRRFDVDGAGRWVNQQAEATIVSPTLHVTRYEQIHAWVIDNWCWDYLPGKGDVVIDVGAGIGEETVVFSKLVGPTGRVISIEAHPDTFACLSQTVLRSKLTNVTTVQCAVVDQDGEIAMSSAECHVASSVLDGGEITVPARSLDSLLAELDVADVAFMKMNIEGAEKLAIKGMTALFPRLHATCISCHDFVADLGKSDDFRSKADVLLALEAQGYRIRTRADHPDSWVRDYYYASRNE
jgi:FkbM family methyltransferase